MCRGCAVKAREERRKVLIRARMRSGATWGDVCILNISSRGLQLQAPRPPERGAYVEVRRGPQVIVGRVAWSKQHRFGIRSQDVLFIDSLIAEPDSAEALRGPVTHVPAERRAAPRRPASADHRLVGQAMEFACLGIAIIGGATLLYGAAESAFAAPLASVSKALSP